MSIDASFRPVHFNLSFIILASRTSTKQHKIKLINPNVCQVMVFPCCPVGPANAPRWLVANLTSPSCKVATLVSEVKGHPACITTLYSMCA